MGTSRTEVFLAVPPKWMVKVGNSRYIAKTADTEAEIEQALRLRHLVFYNELLNNPLQSGLDSDRFDQLCDHLIVQTRDTGQVVATYRLNTSSTADFYSRQEFDMDAVLGLPGRKLEMGRACVARDHRSKLVFAVLWRGLTAYMQQADIRYAFGCASVPIETPHALASLYQYFRDRCFSPDTLRVRPLDSGMVAADLQTTERLADDAVRRLIPPLLQFYLHCGCVVCGEPYYDTEFKTYDFFTLLDLKTASPVMQKFLTRARQNGVEQKAGGM